MQLIKCRANLQDARRRGGVAIFQGTQGDLTVKLGHWNKDLKEVRERSVWKFPETGFLGRGNSPCKGPGAGLCPRRLVCCWSRVSREEREEARAGRGRGRSCRVFWAAGGLEIVFSGKWEPWRAGGGGGGRA